MAYENHYSIFKLFSNNSMIMSKSRSISVASLRVASISENDYSRLDNFDDDDPIHWILLLLLFSSAFSDSDLIISSSPLSNWW